VVNVPQIIARDREQGFMLLEDLGKITLLAALEHDARPLVHRHLLLEAVDTLVPCSRPAVPMCCQYDEALLRRELSLFPEWYCAKELGKPLNFAQRQLWDAGCEKLLAAILPQSKVFVHRDFIVRNLMLTPAVPACWISGRGLWPHQLRSGVLAARCLHRMGRGFRAGCRHPLLGKSPCRWLAGAGKRG
jgi:aminoglycoside/choline kinase family phosphotransferase